MTRIIRTFAAQMGKIRSTRRAEPLPREVAMAAIGVPAPEFM